MRLLVFDLDGTLTATNEVDTQCFLEAIAECGFAAIEADWGRYEHTTDAGIAAEFCATARGRPATVEEIESIKARVAIALRREAARSPAAFAQIAGASSLLELIAADRDQCAALATGAWAVSAQIKWAASGLGGVELPMATADDALSRVDIVDRAIAVAQNRYGIDDTVEIVLVGDGPWDVSAARELGHAFVGVAGDGGSERLRAAGAVEIVHNYRDPQAFFAAVDRALLRQSSWTSRSSKLA